MASAVKGFPQRFPVRDDDRRPWRYRTASLLSRVYLRLLSRRRLRITGEANIPRDGPLIVACNHTSNLDPMVIGGYFPRTLFAMAKRELYFTPAVAWFLGGCNCIPVDRGGADRRAVTRALDVLRRRGRLLIFVEGTRSRDGKMHRAEAGVGFLARRGRASILPVALSTDERKQGLLRRRQIMVRYGEPFELELMGRRDDDAIADEIATRIAALLPAARRGVYGDGGAHGGTSSEAAGLTSRA